MFFTRYKPSVKRDDFSSTQKSKTQQHFLERSDVNWIVKHYQEIPDQVLGSVEGPRVPLFGDFSAVPDLRTAQATLLRAEAAFGALPADLRLRFNNNPLELLAFVQDSANREEAVKLGLIDKVSEAPSVVPAAPSVSVVNKETIADS